MDPPTHNRYLDYRERCVYFGKKRKMLSMVEFSALDAEHRALIEKGDTRDDEEEARLLEVSVLLLRD